MAWFGSTMISGALLLPLLPFMTPVYCTRVNEISCRCVIGLPRAGVSDSVGHRNVTSLIGRDTVPLLPFSQLFTDAEKKSKNTLAIRIIMLLIATVRQLIET